MDAVDLAKVRSGIDVVDVGGDKVGTVAHVYRHAAAPLVDAEAAGGRAREEIVEVKTGPLGLGKHLYIPLRAIDDLNDAGDCLALNVGKDQLDRGWESKPDYLGELTS